jgi:hypothetical protein
MKNIWCEGKCTDLNPDPVSTTSWQPSAHTHPRTAVLFISVGTPLVFLHKAIADRKIKYLAFILQFGPCIFKVHEKNNKCINPSMYWYSTLSYMFRHFKMPPSGNPSWSCWDRCPMLYMSEMDESCILQQVAWWSVNGHLSQQDRDLFPDYGILNCRNM